MWKQLLGALGVIAALASILALFFTQEEAQAGITRSFTAPAWALAAIVGAGVAIGFFAGRLLDARRVSRSTLRLPKHATINPAPKLYACSDCVDTLASTVLRLPSGTFSTWVYLHGMKEGLRKLDNNRYFVACTPQSHPYANVFSVSYGPDKFDPPREPTWRLWLADESGDGKVWRYPDSREFEPGWRLLTVRWNHALPALELLIDGRSLLVANDYERFWPEKYPDRLCVGGWPNRATQHLLNTYLWRTQLLPDSVTDDWISSELALPTPRLPEQGGMLLSS